MKRIDAHSLRQTLPPMPEAFETRMLGVLRALPEQKKGRIMKKKLSLSFALILILSLLAAAALALTLSRAFFEDVAVMQFENGYYDDWTLQQKLRMLSLMGEHGVTMDEEDAKHILDDKMPDNERERRLDAFMAKKYGINGRTDVIGLTSILEKELGQYMAWSLEDKAWYSKMLLDTGLMGGDDVVNLLPEGDVISPVEAERIARETIRDAFALSPDALDEYAALLEYSVHIKQYQQEAPTYYVMLTRQTDFTREIGWTKYSCYITGDGRVLGSADDPWLLSPWERAAKECAERERIEQGMALGYAPEATQRMDAGAPLYTADGNPYFHLEAACPSVSAALLPMREAEAYQATESKSPCPYCVTRIDVWTLEQKLRWRGGEYGLPSGEDVQEALALEIGKGALVKRYSVTDETLSALLCCPYFYARPNEAPFYVLIFSAPKNAQGEDVPMFRFSVTIDAKTGEVLDTQDEQSGSLG